VAAVLLGGPLIVDVLAPEAAPAAAAAAADLLKVTASSIPLRHRLPHALTSAQVFVKAVRVPLRPQNVTTAFNLAVAHEAVGDWQASLELYKGILAKFPGYRDATLRMARVHHTLGSGLKAQGYLERAAKASPKDPAPPALSGALHMHAFHAKAAAGGGGDKAGDTGGSSANKSASQRLGQAKASFERIQLMDGKLQKDPFAMLAVANVYFGNLHRTSPGNYLKELGWAKSNFDSVLRHDRTNGLAANGVGMVLAEEGHLKQAKDVFSRVKTAVAGSRLGDATVNLAHLLVLEGRHLEAVKNYSSVLKASPHWGSDPELLLLVANAHFCDGRHAESLRALSRALKASPDDASLWSNVGVVQYAFAEELFNRHLRVDRAAVEVVVGDLTAARDFVASAKRIFVWLKARMAEADSADQQADTAGGAGSAAGGGGAASAAGAAAAATATVRLRTLGMDEKKLSELISFCGTALEAAPERLRVSRELAEQRDEERRARAQASKEVLEQQQGELEAARVAELASRVENIQKAKAKQAQLQELQKALSMQHASKATRVVSATGGGGGGKKGSGAQKQPAVEDMYDDSDDDNDAAASSSSSSSGNAAKTAAPPADLGLSSDEDDNEGEGGASASAAAAAKESGGADLLGLESDSDDDNAGGGGSGGVVLASAQEQRATKRPAPSNDLGLDSDDDGEVAAAPSSRLKKKRVAALEDDEEDEEEFDDGLVGEEEQEEEEEVAKEEVAVGGDGGSGENIDSTQGGEVGDGGGGGGENIAPTGDAEGDDSSKHGAETTAPFAPEAPKPSASDGLGLSDSDGE